jgi:hypothetical protein
MTKQREELRREVMQEAIENCEDNYEKGKYSSRVFVENYCLKLAVVSQDEYGEIINNIDPDIIYHTAKEADSYAGQGSHKAVIMLEQAMYNYFSKTIKEWYEDGVERYEAEHNIDVMEPSDYLQRGD